MAFVCSVSVLAVCYAALSVALRYSTLPTVSFAASVACVAATSLPRRCHCPSGSQRLLPAAACNRADEPVRIHFLGHKQLVRFGDPRRSIEQVCTPPRPCIASRAMPTQSLYVHRLGPVQSYRSELSCTDSTTSVGFMVFTEIIVFTDKFDRTILRLRRAFSCRPFALVCAGKRSAMIVGVIAELLLVPLVLVPFVLEPFLPRHVQKLRDSEHGRFIFLLHGSGANSANYCFGRFFLALNGHKANVVFFNYLGGPIKTSPRGNITTLSAEVARQFETTLYDKILEKDADGRQGTTRSSTGCYMRLTVLGHFPWCPRADRPPHLHTRGPRARSRHDPGTRACHRP